MNLFWLLFSTQGKLDRKKFWISILLLNLSSVLITFIGDNVFTSYEPTRISFLAFFLSKMMPRFYSIFVLISSFFLAKKRVNDIGSNEWIPIVYVIALFIPTFMSAIGSSNLIFFSGLFPLFIMFEDKGVMDSFGESWNLTEEVATKLFALTAIFMSIQISFGFFGGMMGADGSLWFLIAATAIKYATLMPLFYLFFTLYKSNKSNQL